MNSSLWDLRWKSGSISIAFASCLLLLAPGCGEGTPADGPDTGGQATVEAGDQTQGSSPERSTTIKVVDQDAFNRAVDAALPGDEIVLANGQWDDFEIVFDATGSDENPIVLTAETPGEVVISGKSNLSIAGEHLVVRGLTFRGGYSPSDEVISFRSPSGDLANHVTFTENVIENFSKPDRREQDSWVVLHGRDNRVSNNAFIGKTNKGPTLIVRLDNPGSEENNHVIERNYFGERPPLGGNGGETLRIGVSQTSRVNSGTVVRENYFEQTDGEVEIISIKSENNLVTENVFYEARGSVVFRHGGKNEVSRNVFMGNGVRDTGGIRVINDNQVVRDNYLEGIRGRKFPSALVVMNGVPNSPENRYHQVENALIANNSFIDVTQLGLGVGSDEERSAVPVNSEMTGNLLISDGSDPLGIFDDMSGITFANNISDNAEFEKIGAQIIPNISLARAANGLLYVAEPVLGEHVGVPRDLAPIDRSQTGPRHYEKPPQDDAPGEVVEVPATEAAIRAALAEMDRGEVLKVGAGTVEFGQPLRVQRAVMITGTDSNASATVFKGADNGLFILEPHADLTIESLTLVQASSSTPLFHAEGEVYRGDYRFSLSNSTVSADPGLTSVGPMLAADPETFAMSVTIDGVFVRNWPGSLIAMSGSGLDGWYLADDVFIRNSSFSEISGPLVTYGREGRDESTFGPRFTLERSEIENVGLDGLAIDLMGVDGLSIHGNSFVSSGRVDIKRRVLGYPFSISENDVAGESQLSVVGVSGEDLKATMGGGIK